MSSELDVARIDTAINEVSDPVESQCELLREHLEGARTYLLGSMAREYFLNLKLATAGLNCISNQPRRERVRQIIDELLRQSE